MEEPTLLFLVGTAATIGLFHTVTGPDHFLPFIAMSRAGNWSLRTTVLVTAACGVGHVASSVVLGLAGLALGSAVLGLTRIEEFRGDVAGWLLLGFGLAYMVWGLRRAWRNRPHAHVHAHADGSIHYHAHTHDAAHAHVHAPPDEVPRMTPWILFAIFIFGPCEPLIPLLMYPAAKASLFGSMVVAVVFGIATLSAMLTMVVVGYLGLVRFASGSLERYAHAACGGAVAACGAAVCFGL